MGPIFGNFVSWWQLLMLIIGQPDRMFTELKKVNEADSYLLRQWSLVSGDNDKVSNLVFSL